MARFDPEPPSRGLRIAVLSRHFDPAAGGAERYAVTLASELAARHEVHVFAQSFGGGLSKALTLHALPRGPAKPRWINQLWYAICASIATSRCTFDVVHSHENTWTGVVQTVHVRTVRTNLLMGKAGGRLWLAWLKILTSPRLLTYVVLEALRLRGGKARAVVAVSQPLRVELQQAYPALTRDGAAVITPGVRMPADASPQDKAATRERLALEPRHFVLLFVANDHAKKGLPAVLGAMADLGDADLRLVVLGNARDQPDSERVAASLGVAEQVRFVGKVADPAPWYDAADALVHPALEDTFGMVVLEALSHGLPTIVSCAPWCGAAADLADGQNALLLDDPRDAQAVAKAIGRLKDDAGLRAQLGRAGREHAKAYDWAEIAQQHEVLYQTLLGRHQSNAG